MTNIERIKKELQEDGVVLFNNKNVEIDYLTLPKDLTILSTSDISKYLNAIVQQRMYVRTLMSDARAVYREAKSIFDKEKCRVFSECPQRMSVTEKELRVFNDSFAEGSRKAMEYALEKYDYLSDILKSYEDGTFLVSRELSRRLKDFEDSNRSGKFNA